MTYGAPVRQGRFSGLDIRRKESRNDGSALVFENVEIRQVGTFRKRNGIVRATDRKYPGPVNAVIPSRHCYFLEQWIYGIDPADGTGMTLEAGPAPAGRGRPLPVKNLDLAPGEAAGGAFMLLVWDLPVTRYLSGVRIRRKVDEDPVDETDGALIYDGVPIDIYIDIPVLRNVDYHYGVWTYWLQGA